jgi:hypothetical protein
MFGKAKPVKPIDLKATFTRCMEELELKQQANCDAWGLDAAERWDADLDTGEIAFTFLTGLIVTAPVQIIGSYDAKGGTWMWAWDNPSIEPELAEHARLVRRFGERHDVPELTTPIITATEADASNYVALACHLAGATGVYRGPGGSTAVYFTFGNPTFHKLV